MKIQPITSRENRLVSRVQGLPVATPDASDVHFDNAGGDLSADALSLLRMHGSIITCGGISGYDGAPRPGTSGVPTPTGWA